MKTWQAVLIVAAILLAALINGGIYQIAPAGVGGESPGSHAYVVNKFTGRTWLLGDATAIEAK